MVVAYGSKPSAGSDCGVSTFYDLARPNIIFGSVIQMQKVTLISMAMFAAQQKVGRSTALSLNRASLLQPMAKTFITMSQIHSYTNAKCEHQLLRRALTVSNALATA